MITTTLVTDGYSVQFVDHPLDPHYRVLDNQGKIVMELTNQQQLRAFIRAQP